MHPHLRPTLHKDRNKNNDFITQPTRFESAEFLLVQRQLLASVLLHELKNMALLQLYCRASDHPRIGSACSTPHNYQLIRQTPQGCYIWAPCLTLSSGLISTPSQLMNEPIRVFIYCRGSASLVFPKKIPRVLSICPPPRAFSPFHSPAGLTVWQ